MMMANAIAFAVYSLLWATAPYDSINLPARLILDLSDWPLDHLSDPLDQNTQWLVSISSGLLAAISVFLGGIIAPALRRGDRRTANLTALAMLVWYVIDSLGSYASGVATNVVPNSLYLLLILIPLIGIPHEEEPVTVA